MTILNQHPARLVGCYSRNLTRQPSQPISEVSCGEIGVPGALFLQSCGLRTNLMTVPVSVEGGHNVAQIEPYAAKDVYDPPMYSQAVKVSGAETFLYIAG